MKKRNVLGMGLWMLFSGYMLNAQSETFRMFEGDLQLGYAIPTGDDFDGGFVLGEELRFNFKDYLAFGLTNQATYLLALNSQAGGLMVMKSNHLLAEYYTSAKKVRPLFGLGFGLNTFAGVVISAAESEQLALEAELQYRKVSLLPRIGLEIGHFRLTAEYNLMLGAPPGLDPSNISIKIAGTFGGGMK